MIRNATTADLPRIVAITNEAIEHGTALWTWTPVTPEQRRDWMEQRQRDGWPVLVAEHEGEIAGFGSFGPFRPHDGYRHTVEHSLYIDPAFQRRGLGDAMLGALIRRAREAGLHAMVGGLAADNVASRTLHERHGFRAAGILPQVGRKFERWLDLLFMVLVLDGERERE